MLRAAMLSGLGEVDALDREIDGFLLRAPTPTSTDVSSFLQLYSGAQRTEAAHRLIARGVSAQAVSNALAWLDTAGKISTATWKGIAVMTSAAVSAYHGYRRNDSITWGIIWFALGTVFPIFTPVIALAQGYGKPKK